MLPWMNDSEGNLQKQLEGSRGTKLAAAEHVQTMDN